MSEFFHASDPVEAMSRAEFHAHIAWVGPGVRGFVENLPHAIVLHWLSAVHPGNGDVGRWLDRLPPDRRIEADTVLSDQMRGMLERRGFKPWGEAWMVRDPA